MLGECPSEIKYIKDAHEMVTVTVMDDINIIAVIYLEETQRLRIESLYYLVLCIFIIMKDDDTMGQAQLPRNFSTL